MFRLTRVVNTARLAYRGMRVFSDAPGKVLTTPFGLVMANGHAAFATIRVYSFHFFRLPLSFMCSRAAVQAEQLGKLDMLSSLINAHRL